MKIIFLSNYFNHHQKPFSDEMFKLIGENYFFIETTLMSDERRKMGYEMELKPSYVLQLYNDDCLCRKLIDDADVVITGSAPEYLLDNRKKERKIIVRYAERPLKNGNPWYKYPTRFIRLHRLNPFRVPIYMLCASAYTAYDYGKFALFKNKTYKWGYFTKTKKYESIEKIIENKKEHSILWVGRFIDWKHPEHVVNLAKYLISEKCPFEINMIGGGEMEDLVKKQISDNKLEKYIHLLGLMKPENVREQMEKCEIFISTSDQHEGWGAVLNESMSSACAVVANKKIGAVPFLIKDGENGFSYESINELNSRVKLLLQNNALRNNVSINAYKTMTELWSPEIAAKRCLLLLDSLYNSHECDLYKDGPCSRA